MVEQLCKYSKNKTKIKTQWILHLKWVNFMVYKLHFYRAVKKNKNSLLRPLLAYMISSWLYAHQSLNQKKKNNNNNNNPDIGFLCQE